MASTSIKMTLRRKTTEDTLYSTSRRARMTKSRKKMRKKMRKRMKMWKRLET